jgi:hypothetical protein
VPADFAPADTGPVASARAGTAPAKVGDAAYAANAADPDGNAPDGNAPDGNAPDGNALDGNASGATQVRPAPADSEPAHPQAPPTAPAPIASPSSVVSSVESAPRAHSVHSEPVLPVSAATEVRARWRQAVSEFVDDPAASVGMAGDVIADAVAQLRAQHPALPDTEARRQAILTYRAILDAVLPAAETS